MVQDYKYLIIGGTTKAGTTSVFNYLKDHPEVCPASIKETRFFLDKNYPIKFLTDYHISNGIEEYENFFKHCKDRNKIRVEATPDYLHSEGTAELIYKNLPHSKIVFILRDPIERLISWYRFAQQNNFLDKTVSFEDYIEMQLKTNKKDKQYLMALEQGKYSKYLQSYFELFGKEKIFIMKFENLSNNPKKTMQDLSKFINIDSSFYDNYDFIVHNKTLNLKYPKLHEAYRNLRINIKKYTHSKPFIHKKLSKLKKNFDKVYIKLNSKETSKNEFFIKEETLKFLKSYYSREEDI